MAENAALRKFIIESCYTYDGDGSDICDSYVSAEESPLFPSSTDTESILNSLRAEGVEMVADAIGQKCSELKVGSKEWKSLKSIVFTLISFSSQLRAGDADKVE
ncbi:hypothetical protein CUN67_13045 [Pantoea cypripedii]|uniref:Uncharacterized protein n=1 Tax=Pantoea cypripedii TaxID=55209 RepID=A0A6B9G3E2_PANCY|nr:hypothetical protein CUN67_13045 [Pantoea cypripedii]